MIGRIRTAQDLQRIATAWAVAAREWTGFGVRHVGRRRRPEHRQRHHKDRPRRLQRRRDQVLGRHDLEARGWIESEPESRLRDERIEHRRAA
jgi:hypothetical protein